MPHCERGTAVRPPLFGPCLLWLWATVATIDMGQEEEGTVATVAHLSYCGACTNGRPKIVIFSGLGNN